MLHLLTQVEQLLPEFLQKSEIWKTVYVDYHPPIVERLWTQWGENRIYLAPEYQMAVAVGLEKIYQQLVKFQKGEESRDGFIDSMEDPRLDRFAIQLLQIMAQGTQPGELIAFFNRHDTLLQELAFHESRRSIFMKEPELDPEFEVYNNKLRDFAVALMDMGLNPFDFSRNESK